MQMLKQSFNSKDAAPQRQAHIVRHHGVRWSPLNAISGWLPSTNTVLDFMHNGYMGRVAHFFVTVIFGAYMLSGTGGDDSLKQKF